MEYNTPEALTLMSNMLTKQGGSVEHDSQVSLCDAVGYPKYLTNKNGEVMKGCDMGGSVVCTHHWAPLKEEVKYVTTEKDYESNSFEFPTDTFVHPMVECNYRFGFFGSRSKK
jgi:hypothetical protein